MKDLELQTRFVQLRAQGWSYARIAAELQVAPSTLVYWSRKLQHEIQNLRAIRAEALYEQHLLTEQTRVEALANQLKQVEGELARRDLSTVPTWRLFALAVGLRREIGPGAGPVKFSQSSSDVPPEEVIFPTLDWKA